MSDKIWLLAGLIVIQRLLELRLAARNRKVALAAGAQEFGAAHYPLFFMLHTGWLLGWMAEARGRGSTLSRFWSGWVALFIAAQGLRYWCIASLGRSWNTRILVTPGAAAVRRGPYRFLTHPNYVAVTLELFSVPLIFGAWVSSLIATALNAALLLGIRIPAEEKALQLLEKDVHCHRIDKSGGKGVD